jgi:hypothetical protein
VVPTFRKLSREELEVTRTRRRNSVDLTEYTDFIAGLSVGEGGEVTLNGNEQKRTVKRRLTAAAHQLGRRLVYRRSVGNTIRFEIGPNSVTT